MIEDDRGWVCRVRRSKPHFTATLRPRKIHPELKAGDWDKLAIDYLACQRQEFVLHIGESDIVAGAQERSRFKEVACAQAFLPQDPIGAQLDPPKRTQFRSERILVVGRVLNINTRVILEVTTYLAHIRYHINTMLAQRIGVSDTGEHQQFGCIESASAKDHLPFGGDHTRVSVSRNLDPARLAILDDDPLYKGVFHDMEVWPLDCRREIRACRTPAQSLRDKCLGNVEPFLFISVVVWRESEPCLFSATQECVIEFGFCPTQADLHRSVAAAPFIGFESPRFHLAKVRQAMGTVPLQQSISCTTVIIHRNAAHVYNDI